MSEYTTNYELDKYSSYDKPNLRDQYNRAMDKIDTVLHETHVDVYEAKSTAQRAEQTVAGEVTARKDADTQLQTNIDNEVTAREGADAQIRTDFESADAHIREDFTAADAELRGLISHSGSKSYVGSYGANENDATVNWQSIINQIAAVSNTVNFGSGSWIINEVITFPENISCVSGNGAQITTTANVDTLFTVTREASLERINGLIFNCNRNVGTVIKTMNTNKCSVFGCDFYNWNVCAIDSNNKLGSFISNCQFDNNMAPTPFDDTGIKATTDSFIVECKFFNTPHGVLIGDNSTVSNCYFWGFSNANKQIHCIESYDSNNKIANISVTGCEFDCPVFTFTNVTQATITGNRFYWNANEDTYTGTHAIFNYVNGDDTHLTGVIFNNNVISASGVGGKVNTFLNSSNHSLYGGYTSKGNIVNIPSAIRSKFALSVGMAGCTDPFYTTDNIGFHFVPIYNHISAYSTTYKITLGFGDALIERRGGSTRNFSMVKALQSSFMDALHWVYNNNSINSDFYVKGKDYQMFKEIEFGNNEIYNMELVPEALPSSSDYTDVAAVAAIS